MPTHSRRTQTERSSTNSAKRTSVLPRSELKFRTVTDNEIKTTRLNLSRRSDRWDWRNSNTVEMKSRKPPVSPPRAFLSAQGVNECRRHIKMRISYHGRAGWIGWTRDACRRSGRDKRNAPSLTAEGVSIAAGPATATIVDNANSVPDWKAGSLPAGQPLKRADCGVFLWLQRGNDR